jgi:methyl-accepting chemotaxis protein
MKLTLITKIVLLVSIGILASTTALVFYISSQQKKNTIETATISAKSTIEQFKTLRAYYTENVIKKTKEAGLKADFDHKGIAGVVPLPATMIHDLSEILNKKEGGARLNLYSTYPFPNRKDRALDGVALEALEEIQKNNDLVYVKVIEEKDLLNVRVAIADKMGDACVACHNNHPLSPKKDWKVGDVRGVLEVDIPMTVQRKASQDMIVKISWMSLFGACLLVALIVSVIWWGTIKPFQATVDKILATANTSESISGEVSMASTTVANNSCTQADAVQKTTQAFQSLMNIVQQKSQDASKASELSKNNNESAKRGATEIVSLVASIQEVSESSKRIQDISTLIDDISFQTNLLALNAAVEAARAGEQGRGFAVVADAVRSLAQKSAIEAKNIADIVRDNSDKSTRSLQIAKNSGVLLNEIVTKALSVADLIKEVERSNQAELETLRGLNSSMDDIHQAAQSNAASSEQTTASMNSLESEIKSLRGLTSELESLVGQKPEPMKKAS